MTREDRTHAHPVPLRAPAAATRLVALGDPHGAIDRVRAALAAERNPQAMVVTVGDVIGYADGPTSASLVRFLEAEGIPSVRGNHEDWMTADGTMFLVAGDGSTQLDLAQVQTVRAWPWDMDVTFAGHPPVRVTHSLHDPGWEWVTEETVKPLLARTGRAQVVVVGHSHRPAIYEVDGLGRITRHPFPFADSEALDLPIARGIRYVLDAGSLARPELSRTVRDFSWGTYGVVDLAAATLSLRRLRAPVSPSALPPSP